ncbi:hypothetical protein NF27_FX00450 [Candidatus Jidaibacter acanthamoeba]|uniref:Uncharacterized protein n=1 Tax=Candidatus Jidaibacter acanthamoebae TaxID=86105 RepID=A0A0C1QGU4_9RICK|nr:hypothetical protein [Candidatus Jidaibacter acanthamoeba]KIE04784.1 hypothetical protein NF27_FX00450 [Candidatus Jidaibacter acanthamoeba]
MKGFTQRLGSVTKVSGRLSGRTLSSNPSAILDGFSEDTRLSLSHGATRPAKSLSDTSKEYLTIGELEKLSDIAETLLEAEAHFNKGVKSLEIEERIGFIIEAHKYANFLNYGPIPNSTNYPSSVRKMDAVHAINKAMDLLNNEIQEKISEALKNYDKKANVVGLSETIKSDTANKEKSVAERILENRGKEQSIIR